ncbi:ferredoxin reductase family protein [Streptomyces sp. 549]|uniref:ferredoxin reductase family protein n=1 Tax=Streptomyces sp. 549 TaxID=3049076 RepID=UPI0024C287A8|nr:ferredoxin reductase family protein [Streptomyces sp. 549]MDK1476863.1 ferredoxin reductase family protein [Streptomyces sp. 549]
MRRAGLPPAVLAQMVLGVFLVGNLVVVEALFLTAGAGKNSILTVAKFFGMHAALLMLLQLLLVARLPWLDNRIGMDRMTVWHRWVGFTLLWTVLLHGSLVVLGYAALGDATVSKTFMALAGVPASLLGMLAAALVVVAAATSARRLRRRLKYETWHRVHLLLYGSLGLAFFHQLMEPSAFHSSTAAHVYWWLLWTASFGSLIVWRLLVPLYRNLYHRYEVAGVTHESHDVVSVYVTGRHLDRLPARAGQFFIWRFPGHHPWGWANPFSLSAAPDGRSLRLSARVVGDTTAGLRNLPVGTRAVLEGPYGALTLMHRSQPGALYIAGGMGVTPIRSLLEAETGTDVTVIYRVRGPEDAVLLHEIRALVAARGWRLHVFAGRSQDGVRPFDPAQMGAGVPDIASRDVYVCGPPAMTSAVLAALRALDVPGRQVHAEKFALG